MYVRNDVRPSIILWFSWRHILFFAAYSFGIYYAFHVLGWKFMAIPFLPIGTIGTAVAFYAGFKNNASYERLWEGRKIWGSIASLSHSLGLLICTLPAEFNAQKEKLVRRQIAWCNLLRLQLRSYPAHRNAHKIPPEVALIRDMFGKEVVNETVESYMDANLSADDLERVKNLPNKALALMQMQVADIQELEETTAGGGFRCEKLMDQALECIKEQGSAERLKSFPFPRQYAHFSGVFVWLFLLLLPFGMVDELAKGATNLDWLTVPFSTIISWMFVTMEQVGDSSEDPFELALNDVPMSAICRNIEIDLLQILGEKNLPAPMQAVQDVLV